jgi:prepilin-type N-terminal cleavage/methylation domain-containing protein
MKKLIHNSKANKGFTLIEALIAITILTFAITATFTAAQSGLSSAAESRDQIASFFLAQEAVEFVRNKRDTNSLAGDNWLSGIASVSSDVCYPPKGCTIDVVTASFGSCSSPTSCSPLRQDRVTGSATEGMYGYAGSWTQTNFVRTLQFERINADEIALTVTILLKRGSLTVQTFKVRESIFNWQS